MDKRLLALGLSACLGWPLSAIAALPAQLLADPPEITAMEFARDAIYLGVPGIVPAGLTDPSPPPGMPLGTSVELWYRMDRKTAALMPVAAPAPGAAGVPVSTLQLSNLDRGWSSAAVTFAVTSDGHIYSMGNPDCGQISNNGRLLTMDCAPAGPVVESGESITAIEDFGPNILLGTLAQQMPGAPSSGRGVLVLSAKDDSLQRTISTADGLTGNTIRLIRRDAVTGELWIETPRALAELSPALEVLNVWYLHLDFDSAGVPRLDMTTDPRYDDPYAVLALKLHVADYAGFRQAVAAIPAAARPDLFQKVFPQGYPAAGKVPAAFQPLAPFVIADLQRNPDTRQSLFALRSLCAFGGPAATAEADRLISTVQGTLGSNIFYAVKTCATPATAAAHTPPAPNYTRVSGHVMSAYAAVAQNRLADPDLTIYTLWTPMVWWDGKHPVHLKAETGDDAAPAAASVTRFYASPTLPVDPAHSTMVLEHAVPALASGGSDSYGADVMFPAGLAPGLYFVVVCANDDHKQKQAFEEDRCRIPHLVPPRPFLP